MRNSENDVKGFSLKVVLCYLLASNRIESPVEFRELVNWLGCSRTEREYSEEIAEDLAQEFLECYERKTVHDVWMTYQNLTTIISFLTMKEQETLVRYFKQRRTQSIEGEL